jgi:hypothetical protein
VATGKVTVAHKNRRRRVEFLEFMNDIVAGHPLCGERFSRATHASHPIQLLVRASTRGGTMNVRYRVELSQSERAEL